jgi:hypothetical protein
MAVIHCVGALFHRSRWACSAVNAGSLNRLQISLGSGSFRRFLAEPEPQRAATIERWLGELYEAARRTVGHLCFEACCEEPAVLTAVVSNEAQSLVHGSALHTGSSQAHAVSDLACRFEQCRVGESAIYAPRTAPSTTSPSDDCTNAATASALEEDPEMAQLRFCDMLGRTWSDGLVHAHVELQTARADCASLARQLIRVSQRKELHRDVKSCRTTFQLFGALLCIVSGLVVESTTNVPLYMFIDAAYLVEQDLSKMDGICFAEFEACGGHIQQLEQRAEELQALTRAVCQVSTFQFQSGQLNGRGLEVSEDTLCELLFQGFVSWLLEYSALRLKVLRVTLSNDGHHARQVALSEHATEEKGHLPHILYAMRAHGTARRWESLVYVEHMLTCE